MTLFSTKKASPRAHRAAVGKPYLPNYRQQEAAVPHRSFAGLGRFLYRAAGVCLWLGCFSALVLLGIALASFSAADPGFSISMSVAHTHNLLGRPGAWISNALMYLFGGSSWWIVIAGVFALFSRLLETRLSAEARAGEGLLSVFVSLAGFVCLMLGSSCLERFLELDFFGLLPAGPGGLLGHYFCKAPVQILTLYPALALFVAMVVIGVSIVFRFSWLDLCERIGTIVDRILHWGSTRREEAEDRRIGEQIRQEKQAAELPAQHEVSIEKTAQPAARAPAAPAQPLPEEGRSGPVAPAAEAQASAEGAQDDDSVREPDLPGLADASSPNLSLSLLVPPDPVVDDVDEDSLGLTCRLIESKLKSFGIDAQVVSARPGPVITQFELQPGEGVKGSRIADVCDDLGRALGVGSLRLVMNLPGTTCMGLEMPSAKRQTVRISEIIGSDEFRNSSSKLTLALGKDIAGRPYVVDLAKMPHLLVAGTTGSGKSVGINAMILSILYKSTPEDVRFVMIDPKMVEFSPYEGIPNLLCQVVTDMSKAVNALQWLTREMNRRYAVMRRVGVKRFEAFNEKVKAAQLRGQPIADPFSTSPDEPSCLSPWPYIVVVVDELADLILAGARREVEMLITSLAQKARAAGIHLILATQRPSTDVVTPLIKANIPAHIAFQVVTRYDSQVILGEPGAENLIGNGDMLFRVPGMSSTVRIQGCYVSDEDVENVVAELKKRGEPDYINEVMDKPEEPAGSGKAGGEADALYDKAVEIVLSTNRPTISSLQRHLSIGYNRAANLIEAMEEAGIVSAPDGAGKRAILVPVNKD